MRRTIFLLIILLLSACQPAPTQTPPPTATQAIPLTPTEPLPAPTAPADVAPAGSVLGRYEPGQPALREIWVDAQNGDDANDGATPASALRTLAAAWQRLPANAPLTEGALIRLQPGIYPPESLPNYWESLHGAFQSPIWIRGEGRAPEEVILQGSINIFDSRYLYFENLAARFEGDVFHCEQCDHVLLRKVVFDGGGAAQETVKVNQSRHIYIEDSRLSGAWDNVIDFVAVQYGHILGSEISGAGDWCAYVKGGSAYLRVEGNLIHDCGTGGFTAGQGTGFQFMTPPWIQYEAYDVKIVNNLIRDTEGAGLGVNGGYNILIACNTLARVGSRSHVIEVVFGGRSCDGQPGDAGRERCQQYLEQGGWGTTEVDDGTNGIAIPNRNVFIYNNLVYNPPGFESGWQHFAIYAPRQNPSFSNLPYAAADDNLQIRGNVIWNGDSSMPLGIEGEGNGCAAINPACNEAQLRAENALNTIRPQFVDEAAGDFRPAGDWAQTAALFPIPDFGWDLPGVPPGAASNAVPFDRDGRPRSASDAPGAYAR